MATSATDTSNRKADREISPPSTIDRWELTGKGLRNLRMTTIPCPRPKSGELLVRIDACGICSADIDLINLGPEHPLLKGRDIATNPVIPGREAAVTIAEVGADLADRYRVGDRLIVQPDIQNNDVHMIFGGTLNGAMTTHAVIPREMLEDAGDSGPYVIPIGDSIGYAEAALIAPLACVAAAYEYPNYRPGLLDHGHLLIVDAVGDGVDSVVVERHCHRPGHVTIVDDIVQSDFQRLSEQATGGAGFDDIVVLGAPSTADLSRIASALGHGGIMSLIGADPPDGDVAVDIGRIHHDHHLYLGARSLDDASVAYEVNTRQDLKPGGKALIVGAGSPMGQMHLQRAITLESPPAVIFITDADADRLKRLHSRFASQAAQTGIDLVVAGEDAGRYGPYDDIVCLVPDPGVVSMTTPLLADSGIYNIAVGISRGTTAMLNLGKMVASSQRVIGSSGSTVADMRHTLDMVETGKFSTSATIAAVGGIEALRDAIEAEQAGRYGGKTVIYPSVSGLPLTALEDCEQALPDVYAILGSFPSRLGPGGAERVGGASDSGRFWTREAEEQLVSRRRIMV